MQAMTLEALVAARLGQLPADDPLRERLAGPDFAASLPVDPQDAGSDAAAGNVVRAPRGARVEVRFSAPSRDNVVVVGDVGSCNLVIEVRGSGNLVQVGATRRYQARIGVTGHRNVFLSADEATCNRGNFVFAGSDTSIAFGRDGMLSFDVVARAGDSHGLFDLDTLARIALPGRVLVEPHVWLGEGATLLKGAHVGRGSVVGASAVVTGTLPAACIAVGTPARVVREGVSWTRQMEAALEERERVRAVVRAR